MAYQKPKPGEWVQPVKRGYKMACCDCGLVHTMDFRVHKGRAQFRAWRNPRATGGIRSTMKRRGRLAEYAHDAWRGWMNYLFDKSVHNDDGSVTIPSWAASRWKRQCATKYADLPPDERRSDRVEADKILAIFHTPPNYSSTPK